MDYLQGIGVSAGYVIGEAITLNRYAAGLNRMVLTPKKEVYSFLEAREAAKKELDWIAAVTPESERDIFTFQQMVLEDSGFEQEVMRYILAGASAVAAVQRASLIYERQLGDIDDSYISQRAVDIRDTCRRLIDILDGRVDHRFVMSKKGILVADELYPSDVAGIDKELLLGIVTENGSAESHAAIISNTLKLPAVIQMGENFARRVSGKQIAVDGVTGEVFIEPTAEICRLFCRKQKEWQENT